MRASTGVVPSLKSQIAEVTGGVLDSNRQLTASIGAMTKNSSSATEGAAGLVRSAVTAVNAIWDQVNKAGRQVVEMTQVNAANATSARRTASTHKGA